MESKKINQLATNVNPQQSDLTTIGDPITGQLKKITWLQVAHLIGAQAAVTLQQVTSNGNTTTDPITTGGLTLTNLNTGVPRLTSGQFVGTYGYGLANGVATLDSGGKIPASQLPSTVMEYKGTWNASTNTPTLADGTGDNGDVYLVNVAGSQNLGSGTISFAVGDWVVYNGTIWQKSLNSNAVASVFGRTGTITAQEGDYTIDQLGDVAITSAATNDYLRYNGSSWVNTQFPTFVSSDKLVLQVRNNSGATINKGTVVYINGATAGYPTIAKAQANQDSTSAQTLGLVQDNISNNSNGIVVLVGQITGIDTSAYPAGTQLYLSGTTAGAYTSTKVLAPTHLVYVGIVTTQNAVNGVIEVKIQNGYELDEIHDVAISSVVNNDGIFYESSTSLWKNKSIATVLGYTPEQPLTFSSPLVRTTNTISIPAATGSVNGYLTSTDWTTFNNKLSAAITSLNGLTAATQTFATGTTGTDFTISSSGSTHTFNIPSASATSRGLLDTSDYNTFAGKQSAITLTTTGTSGAATFVASTLNIPQYQAVLTNPVTGTGTNNEIAYFNATGTTIASLSTATYPSLTELSYVKGVTSAIQTQLNSKQATISLTTSGTSGAATFSSNTLNIPNYSTIYSADGTLSGNRTVTAGTNTLTFSSSRTSGTPFSFNSTQTAANASDVGDGVMAVNHTITGSTGTELVIRAMSFGITNGMSGGTVTNYRGWNVASNTSAGSTTTNLDQVYIEAGTYAGTVTSSRAIRINNMLGTNRAAIAINALGGLNNNVYLLLGDTTIPTGNWGIYQSESSYSNYLNGNTSIGTTAGGYMLNVAGTGKFSGALTGTSATFSGTITSTITNALVLSNNTATTQYVYTSLANSVGNARYGVDNSTGGGLGTGTSANSAVFGNAGNADVDITTNNISRLKISSTGAATFSSSATVAGAFISSGTTPYWYLQSSGAGGSTAYLGFGASLTTGAASTDFIIRSENALAFNSNGNNERMRITSGGNVLVNTTTDAGYKLDVVGQSIFRTNNATTVSMQRTNADGIILAFFKDSTVVGSISTNSNSLPSDFNFKKNINNLELGLNLVKKLRSVSYNHKIDDDNASLSTGFIAQEFEKSLTELGIEKNKYYILQHKPNENKEQSQYWLDYTKMIPVLVNAIQEQQAQIEELKAKLN